MKNYRSKKEWQAIQTTYEQSGLSQAAFCSQNKLPLSSFCRWRKILAAASEKSETSLVKIEGPASVAAETIIETGYCKIIVTGTATGRQLSTLFQAIKSTDNADKS